MAVYPKYAPNIEEEDKFQIRNLGTTTNPTVANQLKELTEKLNEGVRNIEVGALRRELFEAIPQHHFKEMSRLAQQTGVKLSLHGPVDDFDLAGMSSKGWQEHLRKEKEEHIKSIIDRAHDLDPKGNIPVVFHASAPDVFAQEWDTSLAKKGEKVGIRTLGIVNQDTGEIKHVPHEVRHYPDRTIQFTPQMRMNSLNKTEWDQSRLKVLENQKKINELTEKIMEKKHMNTQLSQSQDQNVKPMIESNTRDISLLQTHVNDINESISSELIDVYDKFVKFASPRDKIRSQNLIKEIKEGYTRKQKEISGLYINVDNIINQLMVEKNKQKAQKLMNEYAKKESEIQQKELERSRAIITAMARLPQPEVWVPVNDFAKEKAAETLSNVAIHAYNKYKDKAPILAIENFFPHAPMSRAQDLKEMLESARKNFIKKAKEQGLDEKKAKEAAEKIIGATWDVGHISAMRKAGLSEEEIKKFVIEETKKISPMVKHLHITDNFGYDDSHLPPGMGTVPIEEIIAQLEKQGFKGRKIVEAGGWINNFKENPFPISLEYLKSPIYEGGKEPWVSDVYGSYKTGETFFPQQHFNLYGSSFTTLPKELGGQVGGEKSRFSDTPNE